MMDEGGMFPGNFKRDDIFMLFEVCILYSHFNSIFHTHDDIKQNSNEASSCGKWSSKITLIAELLFAVMQYGESVGINFRIF